MKNLFYGYEARKFKSFTGNEGLGFNVELWKDGRKVLFAMDDASGGGATFEFVTKEDEAEFTRVAERERGAIEAVRRQDDPELELIAKDDKDKTPVERAYWNCQYLICAIIDCVATHRHLARKAKAATVFQVGAEIGGDKWRVVKVPFTPEIKKEIVKKFGAKVLIFNETLQEASRG